MLEMTDINNLSEEDDRADYNETEETGAPQEEVGGGDLLIGDLLSLDYPAPTPAQPPVNNTNQAQPVADLLGDIFGGMDVSQQAVTTVFHSTCQLSVFTSDVINSEGYFFLILVYCSSEEALP